MSVSMKNIKAEFDSGEITEITATVILKDKIVYAKWEVGCFYRLTSSSIPDVVKIIRFLKGEEGEEGYKVELQFADLRKLILPLNGVGEYILQNSTNKEVEMFLTSLFVESDKLVYKNVKNFIYSLRTEYTEGLVKEKRSKYGIKLSDLLVFFDISLIEKDSYYELNFKELTIRFRRIESGLSLFVVEVNFGYFNGEPLTLDVGKDSYYLGSFNDIIVFILKLSKNLPNLDFSQRIKNLQ